MSLYVFGEKECEVAMEADKQNGFVEKDVLREFYSDSQINVRLFPLIDKS